MAEPSLGVIHPVILSGGSGTRLWPLSRKALPKQLLPLASHRSMLQETALRVRRPDIGAPVVISSSDHRFIIERQLAEVGITPREMLLEPMGRNTAPAAAVAALLLAEDEPAALVLLLPSDHVIADLPAFHAALDQAAQAARAGRLVTFGIAPDHAATGYGYIRQGAALDGAPGAFAVDRFVEKPDSATAESYLEAGGYFWNSGMFLFRADVFLAELERFEPEMLAACRAAWRGAERDLAFCGLEAQAFAKARDISIDYAVMERTALAAMVPAAMGWNDVGAWPALADIVEQDAQGNAVQGDVALIDVHDCYVRSEGQLVAVLGAHDLVVVATDDAVLVADKDRAQDVKRVVDLLQAQGRPEGHSHSRVYRPWGDYRTIGEGDRFQVKQITVVPGGKLSLQRHHHRAEHWVVVQGTAKVTRGDETMLLHENQSTYIPPGAVHRLENPGKIPLRLIEVQSGAYLGEDDIVRLEDAYGRKP